MAEQRKLNDDFFIGYEEKAPASVARTVKLFVGGIAIVMILTAVSLVLNQRGFADATFELGTLSTLEGTLTKHPVPMVKLQENGQVKSVLLIGFGKFGPEEAIATIEKKRNIDLEGKHVKLEGTRIFNTQKQAFELTKKTASFLEIKDNGDKRERLINELGTQRVLGEILDSKCALGVMKPGYGKPHRSCAINCVSGGITPIVRMTDKAENVNFCILKGADGSPINENVLPFLADQVSMCGELSQEDDWLVFYVNPEDIVRLTPHFTIADIPLCN